MKVPAWVDRAEGSENVHLTIATLSRFRDSTASTKVCIATGAHTHWKHFCHALQILFISHQNGLSITRKQREDDIVSENGSFPVGYATQLRKRAHRAASDDVFHLIVIVSRRRRRTRFCIATELHTHYKHVCHVLQIPFRTRDGLSVDPKTQRRYRARKWFPPSRLRNTALIEGTQCSFWWCLSLNRNIKPHTESNKFLQCCRDTRVRKVAHMWCHETN